MPYGSPINAEYYRPQTVIGIEGGEYRLLSEGGYCHRSPIAETDRIHFTDEEKDDRVYVADNACRLADLVRRLDAATLRRVAAVVDAEDASP